ncbi:hypothetical protein AB0K09_05705 [Streptomyces sp. NPDC049577]|uniref:hypothetical protein n=1 Tax=Streptomyces sp. NPDC049577 TaxID=3155153 RepID=UPI0034123774
MTIDSSPALDWASLGQAFASAYEELDVNDYLNAHSRDEEPPPPVEVVDADEPEGADELRAACLRPVEHLRTYFPHEASDFTPWVAKNLDRVRRAAWMAKPLTLVGTEQKIAGYRIDVLAKTQVDGCDRFVVIENQLERTDADHLGRLITCAAEVNASHAIWISTEFREEHLKVIDALQHNAGGCIFIPLIIDGANMYSEGGKGYANFQFISPPTYSTPDDHLREKLHDCLRKTHEAWLALHRMKNIAELYPGVDFSRYRHLIQEMGLWGYYTDELADALLEVIPKERRTRSTS